MDFASAAEGHEATDGAVGAADGLNDVGADGLTRRDREILAFERQWWKYAGAKEQAIRELFDMSTTRYYQVLNALIDTPAALAADPTTRVIVLISNCPQLNNPCNAYNPTPVRVMVWGPD